MDGRCFAPFFIHTDLALCRLSPFTLASSVSGMFWMKSPMLLGHWQAVGHLCPSVYEELQPFAENSIVTDVNFYRKFYQAKESISFLPMFSMFRWCVRKQRLASVFDRIFLFSTSMPANERQQPHFPLVITGVKTQEMCVCAHAYT